MIHKIKILIATIFVTSNLFAQNLADFTGIYAVKQKCCFETLYYNNNFEEITEYEVEVNISTNDTTELEIKVILFEPYTLGFNVKNDSMFFIYAHEFLNEDSTIQIVGGNGVIYKDSIDLNLSIDNLTDYFYNCDCNGNKIKDVPIGIAQNTLLNKVISLYPNPVKEELRVLWPLLSGKAYNNYRIYNLQGQNVLEGKSQLFESIDVGGLKPGTYIIHFLEDDVSVASGRFVKME